MKTINYYMKSGQITKDDSYKNLSEKFLDKARENLTTMSILSDLNNNPKIKDLLKIPDNYDSNEWVVICGYYAIYTSALALLAKIGFRSKNHAATLLILDEFFVKKKLLDKKSFLLLKNVAFHKEDIERISNAKNKREIAQYSITKQTTKDIAERIKQNAYDFVNKCDDVLRLIKK